MRVRGPHESGGKRRQAQRQHLERRAAEPTDAAIQAFYVRLLDCLKPPLVRDGCWQLLECRPAWDGNPTWEQFLAFRGRVAKRGQESFEIPSGKAAWQVRKEAKQVFHQASEHHFLARREPVHPPETNYPTCGPDPGQDQRNRLQIETLSHSVREYM